MADSRRLFLERITIRRTLAYAYSGLNRFITSQRGRGLLPGVLFLLASLPLATVFWAGLPCSDDTLPHLYRTVQFDLLLHQGRPFLGWGPDLLRGYGYPIFGFYAPLSYWLLEVGLLTGLDVSTVLRLAFWLTGWLAGWGAYTLSRQYTRPAAAFVAGLAYLFAPYLLYDQIARGALPESLALAGLPWAIVAIHRLNEKRTPKAVLLAAAGITLFILTHNVVPILGLVVAVALHLAGLSHGGDEARPRRLWSHLWPIATTLGLALLLTAWFWLPALAELAYTQARRPDPPLRSWPRFEQHLLPVSALVEWPAEPADPALDNPPISRTVGLAQAGLALWGIVSLPWYPHRSRRRQAVMWGLITVASLFFSSQLSAAWWNLPVLAFIQLPTRFLGPASLGVALLTGIGLDRWFKGRVAGWLILIPAMAVALSGFPWLYPHHCPTPNAVTQAELAGATTWPRWYAEAQAELLPRWVDEMPPEDGLIGFYQAGKPVNRLAPAEGVTQVAWESGPAWDRYTLNLTQPTRLLYQAFFFPGWTVRLDDELLPVHIRQPDGLMEVELPAGEHELQFRFGLTPLRWGALGISLLGLVVGLVWARRQEQRISQETPVVMEPLALPLWFAAASLIILKVGLIDRLDTPIRADRLVEGHLAGVTVPQAINFSEEFTYLGYSGPTQVKADQPFVITQYWTPRRPIGVPYWLGLRIADDAGNVWNLPPGEPFGFAHYPGVFGWRVGGYVRDAYRLQLLPGTPPGTYWLEASVIRADIAFALTPLNGLTGADPSQARVGQVQVLPGTWIVTTENAAVDQFAPTVIQPGLSLLGSTIQEHPLRPGDEAELAMLWQATETLGEVDRQVELRLIDSQGQSVNHLDVTVGGIYPSSQWLGESVVRQQILWSLPRTLPTGVYRLEIDTHSGLPFTIGSVSVDAPSHTFTPPAVPQPLIHDLAFARLLGYDLSAEAVHPGESMHLTLFWQVVAETDNSYRVFVHVRDEAEAILTQADGIPVNWTRPTMGWVVGEYLQDEYDLNFAEGFLVGAYKVVVGLYDPATGQRLGEVDVATVQVMP